MGIDDSRWGKPTYSSILIHTIIELKKKSVDFLLFWGKPGTKKKRLVIQLPTKTNSFALENAFGESFVFFYRNISWIFLGETGNKQQKTLDVLFFLAVKVAELWNFAADFFSFPKDAIIPSVKIY